jgi:hypothetical protein
LTTSRFCWGAPARPTWRFMHDPETWRVVYVQGELAPATVCNIGGGKAGCMSYGGIDAGTTCVILFYLREYLMHITRQEACMAYHLVVRDEVQLISLANLKEQLLHLIPLIPLLRPPTTATLHVCKGQRVVRFIVSQLSWSLKGKVDLANLNFTISVSILGLAK